MAQRVVFKPGAGPGAAMPAPAPQPYCYPPALFEAGGGESRTWTCVRTRPRWEKKLAEWLQGHQWAYFLPVFRHETVSGRKRRTSELPLFPGFVFVAGDWEKKDFARTGSVAYVLKPKGRAETRQLHRELRDIWQGLTSGLYVTPVQNLAEGEACRIVGGPLAGAEAVFERKGRKGRLILQVEIMGGGIAVEVPVEEVEVAG